MNIKLNMFISDIYIYGIEWDGSPTIKIIILISALWRV